MAMNNAINVSYPISLGGNLTTAGAVTVSGAFAATFNITAPTNVTFPQSGTLATTSSVITWSEVTGTSQSMAVNNGYILSNALLVTVTLPLISPLGSILNIVGKGAGGWLVAQNAGQSINLGSSTTTVGVAGSLSSTNQFDSIELVCTVANTVWTQVNAPQGNITVV